jgi:transposase
VPAIFNYLFNHPGLYFQQDGGAGHQAAETITLLKSWNVRLIFWPPFSLDLSPIEDIWNRLKDILQEIDPAVHRNSRRLRAAVLRAWEMITDAEVKRG